ncbi:MAG: SOS response-associated peptidase family protein [Ramlibacter sp.]
MCANYVPVTRSDRMLKFFGVSRAQDELPADVWPGGLAPFIRLAEPGSGNPLALEEGKFGLVAPGRAEMEKGHRGHHNARSETVAQLWSFRQAWAEGRRCIIPSEQIYEPFYASPAGNSQRWRIWQRHDIPMGIAGIYRWSRFENGNEGWTFAMLTVNADDHPLMQRFHRHGDEKRMVVILAEADYGPWLQCPVAQAPRFFRQWHGPLEAEAAPLPPGRRFRPTPELEEPAAPKPRPAQAPKPPKPPPSPPPAPTTGDLF